MAPGARVVEILDSTLLKEMREEDPRRWLEWVLSALIDRLADESVHPRAAELRLKCVELLKVVTNWPADLYSPNDAARLMESVDSIAGALSGNSAGEEASSQISDVRQLGGQAKQASPSDVPSRAVKSGVKRPAINAAHISSFPPNMEYRVSDGPMYTPPARRTSQRTPKRPPGSPAAARTPPLPPALPKLPASTPPPLPASAGPPQATPARNDARPARIGEVVGEPVDFSAETCDPRLPFITDPRGPVAEAYRTLFFRLSATSEAGIIMVTCSAAQENSAVSAANLALAASEASDEPVLLVEARFDNARAARLFGFHPSECFGRRLARHRRQPSAQWRVAQLRRNLFVLAVDPSQSTAPALDAQALAEVLDMFRAQGFRHVIVDGPPATPTSDARYVARCVEGVVLVIEAGVSRKAAVRRALQVLGGAPVLGYLLLER
jgi:Mrp family chromosome partitioning ATPase